MGNASALLVHGALRDLLVRGTKVQRAADMQLYGAQDGGGAWLSVLESEEGMRPRRTIGKIRRSPRRWRDPKLRPYRLLSADGCPPTRNH